MLAHTSRFYCALILGLLVQVSVAQTPNNPLPSWNDTQAKKSIITFVTRVTEQGSTDFIPKQERIAVFDNDGTLWSEQPLYFQGFYALDRIKQTASQHPEWKTTEPYKSAIAGDMKGMMAAGEEAILKMLVTAHAGVTAEEFEQSVREWLVTAKHPTTGMKFTQMVYQPMLELLNYLRAHDFKTFIVSGGGVDFMRVFAEEVYGIPPEQVIGTALDASFEMKNGIPTITKTGKLMHFDDKAGKPVGIYQFIGRRPVLAGGNSDGDLQMLQYTTVARDAKDTTPRFGLIVHHTDEMREFAYDRKSSMGKLDKALDEAPQRGWLVVDMKKDWNKVFPVSAQ